MDSPAIANAIVLGGSEDRYPVASGLGQGRTEMLRSLWMLLDGRVEAVWIFECLAISVFGAKKRSARCELRCDFDLKMRAMHRDDELEATEVIVQIRLRRAAGVGRAFSTPSLPRFLSPRSRIAVNQYPTHGCSVHIFFCQFNDESAR